MYRNLKAEMARKGLSLNEMAGFLRISRNTLTNKIKGKAKFTLSEAFDIHKKYFSELDFVYLFEHFKIEEASFSA